MHTATTPRFRRMAGLGLAFACLAAALALPSAAAADQSCYGSLKRLPRSTERGTGVGYTFSCREPAGAFFLVATQELISFDVTADVFDPLDQGGAIRGDDRFGDCGGELPSLGFGCSGTYSALGREVRGSFDTTASPCVRDKQTRKQLLQASLVVLGATGKLTGPYALGRPQDCPRPAKPRHGHKHAASR